MPWPAWAGGMYNANFISLIFLSRLEIAYWAIEVRDVRVLKKRCDTSIRDNRFNSVLAVRRGKRRIGDWN